MDSVNSGSHQSSSDGNDEPYDSRAAEDSLFMHNPSFSSYGIINSSSFSHHHNSIINPDAAADHRPSSSLLPPPSSAAAATAQTAARNPRKRSRASRRAPTTVLTTDTSNFRAMVQEFTGIPSTPFSSSSSNIISTSFSARARLNLFRQTALDRSLPTSSAAAHLRRPSPQKFQPSISNNTLIGSDNIHQQQLPIPTQASDLYSVAANPFLSSLLQTATTRFTVPPSSTADIHDHDSNRVVIGMDGFDQALNSSHGGKLTSNDQTMAIASLPSLLSSTYLAGPLRYNGDKAGGGNSSHDADDRPKPTKMAKYNGGEKGLENVSTTRSEGGIESWICSSDYS